MPLKPRTFSDAGKNDNARQPDEHPEPTPGDLGSGAAAKAAEGLVKRKKKRQSALERAKQATNPKRNR